MTSPTKSFFEVLAQRGHVTRLENEHGRVRFEVTEDECLRQWTVTVNDGEIEVAQGESDADAVLRADRDLFDRVVRGEENLVAAAFRGEVTWTGSLDLIAQTGWLLPGPPGQTGPRKVGNGGRGEG
jgi:putative sterol carrier protein